MTSSSQGSSPADRPVLTRPCLLAQSWPTEARWTPGTPCDVMRGKGRFISKRCPDMYNLYRRNGLSDGGLCCLSGCLLVVNSVNPVERKEVLFSFVFLFYLLIMWMPISPVSFFFMEADDGRPPPVVEQAGHTAPLCPLMQFASSV